MFAGWTLGESILVAGTLSLVTPYAILFAWVTWKRVRAAAPARPARRSVDAAPRAGVAFGA